MHLRMADTLPPWERTADCGRKKGTRVQCHGDVESLRLTLLISARLVTIAQTPLTTDAANLKGLLMRNVCR